MLKDFTKSYRKFNLYRQPNVHGDPKREQGLTCDHVLIINGFPEVVL